MSDVYLGNPNLKKANTQIEFTQEQVLEFLKCKEDPVYFAKNYVQIVSLDKGLVPFEMYPFQEKLVKNFHENRFNICKMPRQTGKSTTVVSYLLHYAVFNDSVNIGILANKAAHRKGTARQITNCIRELTQVDAAGYNSVEQRILGVGKWEQNTGCFYVCECCPRYVVQHPLSRRVRVRPKSHC